MQRDDHGALPHVVAITWDDRVPGELLPGSRLRAEADVSDRLLLAAAVGARDAGDRAGDVGVEAIERAVGHGLRDPGGDRPALPDQLRVDAEQFRLGLVRVGDDAPGEPPG